MTALRGGKHVRQKPLVTSVTERNALIEKAERCGLIPQVNFSQRFVPGYAWMKQQIDAGRIGLPGLIQSSKQDTIFVPTKMISWAAATSPIFFMSSHELIW